VVGEESEGVVVPLVEGHGHVNSTFVSDGLVFNDACVNVVVVVVVCLFTRESDCGWSVELLDSDDSEDCEMGFQMRT